MSFVKVSIIIPVYNHSDQLNKCLQSISQQSFQDYEVVVVDDGSTQSVGVQNFPALKNKIAFYQQAHAGAPKARNFGFSQSHGAYLFFCDADVTFLDKNALQIMVQALEKNPEADFCYSGFKLGWKKFWCVPFAAEKLKKNNYISSMALLRRAAFPGWDESLKKFQDWDLWLTITERGGQGLALPQVLWRATTGGSMSRWRPKIFYKLFKNNQLVKEFDRAKEIVQKKHNII